MRQNFLLFLLFLWAFVNGARAQAVVEIADLWGTVNLREGQDPLKVTCQATDMDRSKSHEFVWTLDSVPAANNEPIVDERYRLTNAFWLKPKVEMDKNQLACKYIERDEQGAIVLESEDSIELRVSLLELPTAPFNAGKFDKLPIRLTVPIKLYPQPDLGQIYWLVDEERRVLPGYNDDHFEADVINVGHNEYEATLVVDDHNMRNVSMDYKYYLVIKQQDEEQSLPVEFGFLVPEVKILSKSGAAQLGTGLYVILGLIVLVLAICVGYCVYKKCLRSPDDTPDRPNATRISENKEYQPAPIRDEGPKTVP